jgi:hypothetical protein
MDKLSADGRGTDRWNTIDQDASPVNPEAAQFDIDSDIRVAVE